MDTPNPRYRRKDQSDFLGVNSGNVALPQAAPAGSPAAPFCLGLYDACPHAPVARAHVRGRGQASYKPKQHETVITNYLETGSSGQPDLSSASFKLMSKSHVDAIASGFVSAGLRPHLEEGNGVRGDATYVIAGACVRGARVINGTSS